MLLVSAIVTLLVLVFAIGQGQADSDDEADRETPLSIFHPTYLVLTAGVANAFLAGDLFNLFVGFEILLFSSYVLITLGGAASRIHAGTTYVVVSLLSSRALPHRHRRDVCRHGHGQPRAARHPPR